MNVAGGIVAVALLSNEKGADLLCVCILRNEDYNILEKTIVITPSINTGYNKLHTTPSTDLLYFTLKSLDINCVIKNQ